MSNRKIPFRKYFDNGTQEYWDTTVMKVDVKLVNGRLSIMMAVPEM